MEKTYSTTEAKNQLSSLIALVEEKGEPAIIEAHGKPRVAVISYEEFESFKKLKERALREQLLKEVRQIRERVRARNQDLTDEMADELAERGIREAFADLYASGRLYPAAPNQE